MRSSKGYFNFYYLYKEDLNVIVLWNNMVYSVMSWRVNICPNYNIAQQGNLLNLL